MILGLEFDEFMDQIIFANTQNNEDWLMRRWIANYEREMSFDEFKYNLGVKNEKNRTQNKFNKKSIEDVKADANNIMKLF